MNDKIVEYSELGSLLPHGFPFRMVDRVIDYEPLKYIRGLKSVSQNEPYMARTAQDRNRFPSGLIVEAIGQLAGVLHRLSVKEQKDTYFILGKISDVEIKVPVFAGDQLSIKVQFDKVVDEFFVARGTAENYAGKVVLTVGELIILVRSSAT